MGGGGGDRAGPVWTHIASQRKHRSAGASTARLLSARRALPRLRPAGRGRRTGSRLADAVRQPVAGLGCGPSGAGRGRPGSATDVRARLAVVVRLTGKGRRGGPPRRHRGPVPARARQRRVAPACRGIETPGAPYLRPLSPPPPWPNPPSRPPTPRPAAPPRSAPTWRRRLPTPSAGCPSTLSEAANSGHPGPADGDGRRRRRPVDAVPQAQPRRPGLVRPRPVRALGRPRVDAHLQPAPPGRLRRLARRPQASSAS